MKVGIIGAGHIAVKMANTLNVMDDKVEAYAIASRDLARAAAFAQANKVQKAYGSYEELLSDPKVDLVYVAVPHSHHYPVMKLCLKYGKNILCEKPFTINAVQAKEIFDEAKKKKIFVAEAMWSRFLPMRKILEKVISSGAIGKPLAVTANLSFVAAAERERYFKPELAGGALLDLGVYPLTFAVMILGTDIKEISSNVTLTKSGVDGLSFTTLIYKDGTMASIHTSMITPSEKLGVIYGEKGYIECPGAAGAQVFHVHNTGGQLVSSHYAPKQLTGFEYQVESCRKAIKAGKIEPPEMPHAETVKVMEIMDGIRKIWGMKYPEE
jgi:predicted dehydrogenase